MKSIAILGDGGWGTALALTLHRAGHRVGVWGAFADYVEQVRKSRENVKFLPGVKIPPEIGLTSDAASLLKTADLAVVAIPTQFIRKALAPMAAAWPKGLGVVSVAKGIEVGTFRRPSEIVGEALPGVRVCVLAGPSHAEEVARGMPALVVAASDDAALARQAQETLRGERFRVYTGDDPVGVELGGALKNVIAIAAGISDGLGLGDNAKSALLSRGILEMARIGESLGGKRTTFFGLTGIGDLITTSISAHGRNLALGRAIGSGKSLKEVLGATEKVAEGAWTVKALKERVTVPQPICAEVHAVLYEGKPPLQAVRDLMLREAGSEAEDLRFA